MADTKVRLSVKLLVDKQTKRVLFAEAGKDFVDFLFHIMSLPVGTVVKLLNANNMVGSLGSLYKSIESLSLDYFEPNLAKDAVLKPKIAVNVPLLALNESPSTSSTSTKKTYRCSSQYSRPVPCDNYITDSASTGDVGGGYVKGVVTYMVMDNLEVKPMSTISGITIINKFHVKDVSTLTEKVVDVGLKEGLAMLKASFETNAVLTTVFIGN
ncbi:uncharacterized protein LOC141614754 [Silene latifolia]|uniref:uncharacterized protein LOC141614754 n=1 Tax=Silene latifolia TaxID=37657 RepID=UPI003D7742E8